MSLTRAEWEDMWDRCNKIQRIATKIWNKKHYKWGNDINWEINRIKDKIQQVIGQME